MKALVVAGLSALLILFSSPLFAADESARSVVDAWVRAASVLVPIGISPLLALSTLGMAGASGLYELPAGLEPFESVLVALLLGLVGVFLHAGRSAKLSKPLAEAAGLGESVLALAVTLALAFASGEAGVGPARAGALEGLLFLAAAGSAMTTVIVVRTALDILIWLSPIPFVDAAFQILKLGLTAFLLALAILAPGVAVALGAMVTVGAVLLARWALRTARFGLTVVYDLTLGRGESLRSVPRDEVVDGDLGPFACFALEVPGLARRAAARVELRAGRWFLLRGPDAPARPLGDGERATLTPTWAGLELAVDGHVVLLPPRYRLLAEVIRRESRATLGSRSRWVPLAGGRVGV